MSALEIHKAVMDQKCLAIEWKPRPVYVSDRKHAVYVVSEASVLVRFVHPLVTYFHTDASTDNASSWAKKHLILLPTPSPTPSLPVEAKERGRNKAEGKEALLF